MLTSPSMGEGVIAMCPTVHYANEDLIAVCRVGELYITYFRDKSIITLNVNECKYILTESLFNFFS